MGTTFTRFAVLYQLRVSFNFRCTFDVKSELVLFIVSFRIMRLKVIETLSIFFTQHPTKFFPKHTVSGSGSDLRGSGSSIGFICGLFQAFDVVFQVLKSYPTFPLYYVQVGLQLGSFGTFKIQPFTKGLDELFLQVSISFDGSRGLDFVHDIIATPYQFVPPILKAIVG